MSSDIKRIQELEDRLRLRNMQLTEALKNYDYEKQRRSEDEGVWLATRDANRILSAQSERLAQERDNMHRARMLAESQCDTATAAVEAARGLLDLYRGNHDDELSRKRTGGCPCFICKQARAFLHPPAEPQKPAPEPAFKARRIRTHDDRTVWWETEPDGRIGCYAGGVRKAESFAMVDFLRPPRGLIEVDPATNEPIKAKDSPCAGDSGNASSSVGSPRVSSVASSDTGAPTQSPSTSSSARALSSPPSTLRPTADASAAEGGAAKAACGTCGGRGLVKSPYLGGHDVDVPCPVCNDDEIDNCPGRPDCVPNPPPPAPGPGECFCGTNMVRNPHPKAGTPTTTTTIGCLYECVPCLVRTRHEWSRRAREAERQVFDTEAALAAMRARYEGAEKVLEKIVEWNDHGCGCGVKTPCTCNDKPSLMIFKEEDVGLARTTLQSSPEPNTGEAESTLAQHWAQEVDGIKLAGGRDEQAPPSGGRAVVLLLATAMSALNRSLAPHAAEQNVDDLIEEARSSIQEASK